MVKVVPAVRCFSGMSGDGRVAFREAPRVTEIPQPLSSRPRWLIPAFAAIAALLVVAIIVGVTAIVLVGRSGGAIASGGATPSPTWSPIDWSKPSPTPYVPGPGTARAVGDPPEASGFKIVVKVLKKNCYGSAGCNITFAIEPDYVGADYDRSTTWQVTYEVIGPEEGPMINTFELTGTQISYQKEEFCSVPSSKTQLTVKVTSISD